MSVSKLPSPATRLSASEVNATNRPSALIDGPVLSLLPSVPALVTLTRSVVCVCRSNTNTSKRPLVSPGTRFDSQESKATRRPSALRLGARLCSTNPDGGWMVLIPSVVPACRSRR
jgi:hypothetical protein